MPPATQRIIIRCVPATVVFRECFIDGSSPTLRSSPCAHCCCCWDGSHESLICEGTQDRVPQTLVRFRPNFAILSSLFCLPKLVVTIRYCSYVHQLSQSLAVPSCDDVMGCILKNPWVSQCQLQLHAMVQFSITRGCRKDRPPQWQIRVSAQPRAKLEALGMIRQSWLIKIDHGS